MKYLTNINYDNIDKGIEDLKKIKFNYYPPDNEQIIYHVYWYGKLDRKQLLCINSYLATQNLNRTKLWIWLDYLTYSDSNKEIIPKHKNIEIKKYTPEQEAKETLFENKSFINEIKFIKFRSDLARVIILYKYGGLYYDLDMILLKDLMCLLNLEFCYSWSYKTEGNNGILRLKKRSDNCKQIMNKYLNINKEFVVWYNQYIFNNDINIFCLPSVMFDPVWILHDKKLKSKYSKLCNLDYFFKKTNETIFFDNVLFAYHWHSRTDTIIEKNSYFCYIEIKINNILKNNNNNN